MEIATQFRKLGRRAQIALSGLGGESTTSQPQPPLPERSGKGQEGQSSVAFAVAIGLLLAGGLVVWDGATSQAQWAVATRAFLEQGYRSLKGSGGVVDQIDNVANKVAAVAPNVANSVVAGASEAADNAQKAVLQGDKIVDVQGSLDSTKRSDPEIILSGGEINLGPDPATEAELRFGEEYQKTLGINSGDIEGVINDVLAEPVVMANMEQARLTESRLVAMTFSMFQAQQAVDERLDLLNGTSNAKTKNLGRLTRLEVKKVWEELGKSGRDEFAKRFLHHSPKKTYTLGDVDVNDPLQSMWLSTAYMSICANEVDSELSKSGISVSEQTRAALTVAQYLNDGMTKIFLRDLIASKFSRDVMGKGVNTHDNFSPDISSLLNALLKKSPKLAEKMLGYLIAYRAEQEITIKVDNGGSVTSQEFADFHAFVRDHSTIESGKINWGQSTQIHWDGVLQALIQQAAETAAAP